MREQKLFWCDCGCGRADYFAQLRVIEIKGAPDERLQTVTVVKRFYVTKECEAPFTDELLMMKTLNDFTRRYLVLRPAGFITRLAKARTILRLQHGIYARKEQIRYGPAEGIARTKRRAFRSTMLFVAGDRMSAWLERYWNWLDAARARRDNPAALTPDEDVENVQDANLAGDPAAIETMRARLVIEHGGEHPDNIVNILDPHRS